MSNRSGDAWRLHLALEERTDCRVEVQWEGSPPRWLVTWNDGPSVEQMRSLVAELGPRLPALDTRALRYDRSESSRAWAVQLVRHLRAGGHLDPIPPAGGPLRSTYPPPYQAG